MILKLFAIVVNTIDAIGKLHNIEESTKKFVIIKSTSSIEIKKNLKISKFLIKLKI